MAIQRIDLGEAAAERELSRVGRQPLKVLNVEQSGVVKTADFSLSTYYDTTTKEKLTFRIVFNQLPGKDADTVDGKTGRDNIKVERAKFIPLNLILFDEDGGSDTFEVKFTRYDEDYMRPVGVHGHGGTVNTWRWNIVMELQEI